MDVVGSSQGGQTFIDRGNTLASDVENTPNIKVNESSELGKDTNGGNDASGEGKKIKEADVKNAVNRLNKFLEGENTHAEYSVHEVFKDIMVKIVDNDTKQVILEVPPKKVLDVVAKLCELVGVVVDKKV